MRTSGEGEDQVGRENVGKCLREEEIERRPWRKRKIRPPKGESGAPGLEGQGPRSGGGAPEPTASSSLPPALSRATPAKAGAGLTRGERLLTSGTAPPLIFPHLLGWQGPPSVGGTAAAALCTPPPLRLPGQRAPGVAAVGCQHLRPRGAPAQAPALPPSQAPTLGRGSGGRGSGNLRGPGCGSRGPSLLFHKPGPSQEQCRT